MGLKYTEKKSGFLAGNAHKCTVKDIKVSSCSSFSCPGRRKQAASRDRAWAFTKRYSKPRALVLLWETVAWKKNRGTMAFERETEGGAYFGTYFRITTFEGSA